MQTSCTGVSSIFFCKCFFFYNCNSCNVFKFLQTFRIRLRRNKRNIKKNKFNIEMNMWTLECISVITLGRRLNCFNPNLKRVSSKLLMIFLLLLINLILSQIFGGIFQFRHSGKLWNFIRIKKCKEQTIYYF